MNLFRDLQRLEFDGFLAPLLLVGVFPAARFFGAMVEHFDLCERAYGELFGGVMTFAFSIGFAISGLRQTNAAGRVLAGLTLLVIVILALLPSVSSSLGR